MACSCKQRQVGSRLIFWCNRPLGFRPILRGKLEDNRLLRQAVGTCFSGERYHDKGMDLQSATNLGRNETNGHAGVVCSTGASSTWTRFRERVNWGKLRPPVS